MTLGPVFLLSNERRRAKILLAERILKAAADGERDPERLIDAALIAVAA
jgi:hypothetical protein